MSEVVCCATWTHCAACVGSRPYIPAGGTHKGGHSHIGDGARHGLSAACALPAPVGRFLVAQTHIGHARRTHSLMSRTLARHTRASLLQSMRLRPRTCLGWIEVIRVIAGHLQSSGLLRCSISKSSYTILWMARAIVVHVAGPKLMLRPQCMLERL